MNKSLITNLASGVLVLLGLFLPTPWAHHVFSTGIFALSGAFTNWLAVYMLFEKVPLLYGSGVVPNRFESFKKGIKELIMSQFFTKENIDKFIKDPKREPIDFEPLVDEMDLSPMFEALTKTVMESPFGQMLDMFGGKDVLQELKEPFEKKMRNAIKQTIGEKPFQQKMVSLIVSTDEDILEKITAIVEKRLSELTPQLVKEIIQKMIKKHLGWLVVWGGVFGGLIGLVVSLVQVG